MLKPFFYLLEKLKSHSKTAPVGRNLKPIAEPAPAALLQSDLAKMELMVELKPDDPNKGIRVYRAKGKDIPNVLLELGRLRELTFRTVGEGTGLERDIDRFDEFYDHYVAWDKATKEIAGAYRIGRVDEILKSHGSNGIYSNTLFDMTALLERDFSTGTLEAGRSFVRPEYQKSLALMAIWMAFGRFLSENPHYKFLMGPVSISNEFQDRSKHLMVSYLMEKHPHEKSNLVTPRNPPVFSEAIAPDELTMILNQSMDLRELSKFVQQVEGNAGAKIPQLIKLYLDLGVRFLAFNKDDDFNTIDGLIWLDIPAVPPRIQDRYFGAEGAKKYRAYYNISD